MSSVWVSAGIVTITGARRQDVGMASDPDNPTAYSSDHHSALLLATGRTDLLDALHWIAEGRPLVGGVPIARLLTPLVAAADAGIHGSEQALRAAARVALRSTLDTSADLVLTDTVISPHRYQWSFALSGLSLSR